MNKISKISALVFLVQIVALVAELLFLNRSILDLFRDSAWVALAFGVGALFAYRDDKTNKVQYPLSVAYIASFTISVPITIIDFIKEPTFLHMVYILIPGVVLGFAFGLLYLTIKKDDKNANMCISSLCALPFGIGIVAGLIVNYRKN